MNSAKKKQLTRGRKAMRTRRRVRHGSDRPRMSVFRSLNHIYCQVIDDESGRTVAAASSRDKALRGEFAGLKKAEVAAKIGAALAERAKEQGIKQVVFDRGSYKYHGRVKALAEAAREGGLEF